MEAGNLVDKAQVSAGVQALNKYLNKKSEEQRSLVTELDGEDVHLQIIFKKIPRMKNEKIKIHLPTSLVGETSDVCLFVKDIDKKERETGPSVRHYKDLLAKQGVKNISEVIPLKTIKLEYGPFEAKRNLSNMYDMFLADSRIIRLLPAHLGKSFYRRKRYPIQVNMCAKNLKLEVEKAMKTTQCVLTGRGSCCQVLVAHTGLTESQMTDNIRASIVTLAEKIPGGVANIRSLHIRTADSPAIPLFMSFSSGNGVELPTPPKAPELDEPEDVSTVFGAKVRVLPSGVIQLIPTRGDNNDETISGKKKPGSKRKRKAPEVQGPQEKIPTPKSPKKNVKNLKTIVKKIAKEAASPSKKVMAKTTKAKPQQSKKGKRKV